MSKQTQSVKELELRASLGFVKDYTKSTGLTDVRNAPNPTREQYEAYLDVYKQDAIVSGAIDTVAEESVRNGFYIKGSKSAKEKATKLFTELNFLETAEVHVRTQHIYGDSFIELKYDEETGKLSELHNLETSELWIQYNVHGDVVGYEQNLWDVSPVGELSVGKNVQSWTPEQIVFLPLKKLGSKVHSYSPLEPATRSIIARTYAHYLLQTIFQNYKPKEIYTTDNNISPAQVEALIASIQAADKDPSKKILNIGGLEVKSSGMYEFKKDLVDILNYFRQEILTVTKVPGIYVGITADSNRGVGEFEANAFMSHLLKIHRQLEVLGNRVLKAAGIKAEFKMKPPSVKSQTDIIDQAKKLRDMGYGDDVITPFLIDNGIDIPQEAKFEEENTISMDDQPSRQGSGKGVTEGKYKLDENGRSDAGKAKQAQTDKAVRGASTRLFFDLPKRFLKKWQN